MLPDQPEPMGDDIAGQEPREPPPKEGPSEPPGAAKEAPRDIAPALATAARYETRGTVIDSETSRPVAGASITVQTASGTQTSTDAEGRFSIEASVGDVLVVSHPGYFDADFTLTGAAALNVSLNPVVRAETITVLGSRGRPRVNVERPVAVDVLTSQDLQNTTQPDLGQTLHYAVPSFNAVKFGINDLAPLVDPATLRGLGPDQTLVLVNNKRRHKVSFFSLNDGLGKGQVGTDINVVPSLALERIEVLRDGAAVQYGSDAIAGAINMKLKEAAHGGAVRIYTGIGASQPSHLDATDGDGEWVFDGATLTTALNFGTDFAQDGFLNTTVQFQQSQPYDRSGTYSHADGWYSADPMEDARLREINNIELDRAILGSAKNTNIGVFANSGKPLDEDWDVYAFGGYTRKEIVGSVFSRSPSQTDKSVLEIFPHGYNPETPSILRDVSIVAGVKGEPAVDWTLDISGGFGSNRVDFFARNTVNPSLGPESPTSFFTGATEVTQTILNADLVAPLLTGTPNLTAAVGTELRVETFEQVQGERESWVAGSRAIQGKDVGSSGREGFTPATDGRWSRSNVGVYTEVESDLTEKLLLGGAVRLENYSDFGSNFSFKSAGRFKVVEGLFIRGSVSRGFRAPSLPQVHYSNYSNIAFANDGSSVVTPFIPVRSNLAEALGISGLKPETSLGYALGVTSQIGDSWTITADGYQIGIDDRIVVSGNIDVSAIPAFVAAGFTDEANIFTNAIDTRTRGLDIVAIFKKRFAAGRTLTLSAAGNLNRTEIIETRSPPSLGQDIVDQRAAVYLTNATPRDKVILAADHRHGNLGVMLRGTRFGAVEDSRAGDAEAGETVFSPKVVTDMSGTYRFHPHLSATLAVNNLFDAYPDLLVNPQDRGEVVYSRRVNQFGTQGRFVALWVDYFW